MAENHKELAEILTQNDAKVQSERKLRAFFHQAVQDGNFNAVKLLIENGFVTLDVKDGFGKSPLHSAVKFQHLDIVKFLIENGFTTTLKFTDCLIYECRKHKSIEVLKYLIDLGVKCNHDPSEHCIPCFSIVDGYVEIWKYSLTCITEIYANWSFSETELHKAVRTGQVDIVKDIVEKQISEKKSDSLSRELAVFIAVENGNEEILKVLLSADYPVNILFHVTPLHIAATFEHSRIIEILLKSGAKINSVTKDNITPLDFAAGAGSVNNVKFLLDAGANIVKTNSYTLSLNYSIKRNGFLGDVNYVTPSVFQNMLKITEMLLIAGDCEGRSTYNFSDSLEYASRLRVFEEIEQNRNIGEFRPEIVRCLLNYFNEKARRESLYCIMRDMSLNIEKKKLLDVILEYCDPTFHLITDLYRDYSSNLQIIAQMEDVDHLLKLVNRKSVISANFGFDCNWIDVLKIVTSRLLLLLPGDQQLEEKKLVFYRRNGLLVWYRKCQQQIGNMKITKLIDESNVTFYDILVKSVEKVSGFIRDKKLLNKLVSSYEEFPVYSNFLKLRVENAKRRQNLKDMCVSGMFTFIKKNHKVEFSSEAIEEILKYISVVDLRRLSAAFNP